MKSTLRTAMALIVALVGLTLSLSAQERFSDLTGTVKDATGAVVPSVKVTVQSETTGRAYEVTTGSDGTYNALNMEPGRYTVIFERQGFASKKAEGVNLLVGKATKLDIALQVGNTAESVTVTEAASLIDLTTTKVANNVTSEEFDRMPKGRSFQSLALTSTSVNGGGSNDIEGGFQVNGASSAENNFVIDGVSVISAINGTSRQNALYEVLSEVQVKTSGLDAEYGGAMGGVISAITKSGGNEVHGEAHYYLSGNSLNSAPVQRLVLSPGNEKDTAYFTDGKFKDNQNEMGGSIGGPIIKNKMFFFVDFSPRFRNKTNNYIFAGNQPGTLTQRQTYHTWFNKLSYDVSPKVRTNFTYLWTPTRSTGRLPSYDGYCVNCSTQTFAGAAPNATIGYSQPQTNYTGQIDWTPTGTSLLTFRGGRFWDDYKDTGISPIGAVQYATSATALPFSIPAALQQATNYSNTPRVQNTDHDVVTRTYFQIDGSKIVSKWGQHTLKAGFGLSKNVNNVNLAYPGGGYVNIFWNGTEPLGVGGRGQYGYYEVNDRATAGSAGGKVGNFYVQDTWRIKRVTVQAGVRFENEHLPSFRRDIRDDAFNFGYGDKIGPRLGFSYDLHGNGKARIYASYGRSYDIVKYEVARGTFGGDKWCIYYRSLDTLDIFSGLGLSKPGNNLWSTNPANPCRDRRVPAFDVVDKAIKPMSSDLYSAGYEFELKSQSVIRVGYVHSQMVRTIEDLGVIDANGNEAYNYANPGEGGALITPPSGATTKPIQTPKPDRRYDALEVQFTRRFSKGYFLNASYVLSRLYGNYAGLANSDEITLPTTGVSSATAQQSGGNIFRQGASDNRAWDLDEVLFDSHGHLNVEGRLATDRPHVFKLYGAKEFKWNGINTTTLGLFFNASSGTPMSTYVNTVNQIPMFVEGRGNMGRTPVRSQTDLNVQHTFKIGEKQRLILEMNMLNLFNQKTTLYIFNNLNRGAGTAQPGSAINLATTDLFSGFDYRAMINATTDQKSGRGAFDPRYGQDALFNPGFSGRFGVKFQF